MFLNQILEEYKEADNKDVILNRFLDNLWHSKFTLHKYKKYYKYEINEQLLDNRIDLIELFNKYKTIEFTVCRSFYKNQILKPIDYIRIHINNMYGYLVDKDVYYNKYYYDLLLKPKKEYYKITKIMKSNGNLDSIDYQEVKNNIEQALSEAEIFKEQSIAKKYNIKFSQYKKLINTYIKRIFDNYIPIEEYEKKHGWDANITVDGWSEDNYIIKYFCKSLTGYMRNYIKDLNSGKYIECVNCGELIIPTNNRQKYCKSCWKEIREQQNKDKALRYYHKSKNFTI